MHEWHLKSRLKKRIHGWACYQLCSWISLVWPETVDKALFAVLRDQFEPANQKKPTENELDETVWDENGPIAIIHHKPNDPPDC